MYNYNYICMLYECGIKIYEYIILYYIIMKYCCPECKYVTDSRNNWYHHKKTKKHIDNIKYDNTNNNLNDICKEKDKVIKEKDKLLKSKDKLIKEHKEQIDHLKSIINDAQITTKNTKATSTLNFVIVNFNNAPALCQIEENKVTEIIENEFSKIHNIKELIQNETLEINSDDESVDSVQIKENKKQMQERKEELYVEKLLSLFKNDRLVEYIKDIIAPLYKKDDPKQQTVWNTDTARLNYVIRDIVGKQTEWITDKKGLKVIKYVIKPITKSMAEMVDKYAKNYYTNTQKFDSSLEEIKHHTERYNLSILLIQELRKGNINDNVCQQLCPEFHLDKTYMNKYIKCDKSLIEQIKNK